MFFFFLFLISYCMQYCPNCIFFWLTIYWFLPFFLYNIIIYSLVLFCFLTCTHITTCFFSNVFLFLSSLLPALSSFPLFFAVFPSIIEQHSEKLFRLCLFRPIAGSNSDVQYNTFKLNLQINWQTYMSVRTQWRHRCEQPKAAAVAAAAQGSKYALLCIISSTMTATVEYKEKLIWLECRDTFAPTSVIISYSKHAIGFLFME